ncbi:MAG: radical SAM family heme chaperone HemW [Gammaproteobacteria bacterium]|nr:radical SAM family heme chaperone HemW [Gammaproteobacteria bacterium]
MTDKTLLQKPPLSLYIHIPWCVRKCPYCDFNSHEAGENIDESAYVEALLADLEQELELAGQQELHSLFFGGGTPSLFSAEAVNNIIEGIADRTAISAHAEITLEANPGTFEQQRFADYRSAGINRLSIGIQSFNDDQLNRLGRIHDGSEAVQAIETAHTAGFDNINLDLMFGLPGQNVKHAIADVQSACRFQPAHVSHYQLTIEPNTYFHKHHPTLPDTDATWEMQQRCHDTLNQHGYIQYEVSAFSNADKHSRHNMNYWTFGDYIGIGAGAHGKLTGINDHSIRRRWKQRQPSRYVKQATRGKACSGSSELKQEDILFEFLMNALRLRKGFSFELFEQRTGINRQHLLDVCKHIDEDLLVVSDTGITTSQRGFDFLNTLLESILTGIQQQFR